MSRAFVSNILDFLDDKGAVPEHMSLKSKRLFGHLKLIIDAVSFCSQTGAPTNIPCWSAPYKKRCKGTIDASLEIPRYDIIWHCLLCGNHGTIRNWKVLIKEK